MSTAAASTAGLVDLEKELTCSICTELLYQPLTLLDCLHTFCGSCLKEWFSWQTSSSSGAGRRPRFTCPSCRASVRDTRHDAKVTTLLDLFLQSNPEKARSEHEREEIGKKYKPNENIFSVSSDRDNNGPNEDERDQRLLTEVREMSLRDVGSGRPRTGQSHPRSSTERSSADRSRERRLEEARRRRRTERQLAAPPPPRTTSELLQDSRQVEHQSSLRSLLSSSEGDSAIEDEILRQITEEGLLDGIDLRNLDPSQEDELTERIADAYRRRFLSHYGSSQSVRSTAQQDQPRHSVEPLEGSQASGIAEQPAAASRSNVVDTSSQPGTSLSHPSGLSSRETRRRRPSPNPPTTPSSSDTTDGQGTGLATNSPRPRRSSQNASPARSSHRRAISAASATGRTVDGRRRRQQQHSRSRSTDHRGVGEQPNTDDSAAVSSPVPTSGPHATASSSNTGVDESRSRQEAPDPTQTRAERRNFPPTSSSRPASSRREVNTLTAPPSYPEPSINCDRCGKQDIQYNLHKSCGKCDGGDYNICLRCYRLGSGCLHWFGFGHRAQLNFDRKYPTPSQDSVTPEPPHILQSQKYLQPSDTIQSSADGSGRASRDDPTRRLQKGNFCDMCDNFADDCFWKCDRCNDGEWGFCNRCVNHGHCCTHPLLAIARIQQSQDSESHPLGSPNNASISVSQPPPNITRDGDNYRTLTFSTKCNMCTYPISPSSTRFHCPECNEGDYDICTNCYLKLCASGRISKENGQNGWRRCPFGHRMIIVGFEDREDGQRRVIVRGLVGGYAMKDDLDPSSPTSPTSPQQNSNEAIGAFPPPPERQDSGKWTWKDGTEATGTSPTSSTGQRRRANRSRNHWASGGTDASKAATPSFPPSGGIGLRMAAVWSYYPDPEESDEIMFPRGAEITEAENINDDWFWGCYAGQKGLFPGGYAGLIERVGGVN